MWRHACWYCWRFVVACWLNFYGVQELLWRAKTWKEKTSQILGHIVCSAVGYHATCTRGLEPSLLGLAHDVNDLGAFTKFRKGSVSFVLSVCPSVRPSVRPPAWNNSTSTGRIFMKFDIWVFFENLARKLKFHEDLTRITGTLREVLCIFMIISPWILRRMRNASNKSCKGTENPCFMLSTFPPHPKIVPFMRYVEIYGTVKQAT